MKADERDAVTAERRVADAFRPPAFDDARAERVLTAARAAAHAAPPARVPRWRAGLGVALAACAAVLLAAVVWPSVPGGRGPAAPAPAPLVHGSASRQAATSTAQEGIAQRRHSHMLSSHESGTAKYSTAAPGLRFTTELLSKPVAAGGILVVRLTLRNSSGGTVRWSDFGFGLSVTTTFQPDPSTPDGIHIGSLGSEGIHSRNRPFELRSGESTSATFSTGVPAGRWQVVGAYGDSPDGESSPIEIIVRKK